LLHGKTKGRKEKKEGRSAEADGTATKCSSLSENRQKAQRRNKPNIRLYEVNEKGGKVGDQEGENLPGEGKSEGACQPQPGGMTPGSGGLKGERPLT